MELFSRPVLDQFLYLSSNAKAGIFVVRHSPKCRIKMMSSSILTRDQVRQFDRIAVERFGIHSLVLMENAARAATDLLCQRSVNASAVILCGSGNNGGDGLVMARHLHLRGWNCKVILLAEREQMTPDTRSNYETLCKTRVPVLNGLAMSPEAFERQIHGFDWIIDALLGTGAKSPLRSPHREFIPIANLQKSKRLAVDLPSGLECDSVLEKQGIGVVFKADLTVTFVALKPVMQTTTGSSLCGEIKVVDIGAPLEVFDFLGE